MVTIFQFYIDALISAIQSDIAHANEELDKPEYNLEKKHSFFTETHNCVTSSL